MELFAGQHPARRQPQRRRAADGAIHVRQRAARAPLRHIGRPRRSFPPRRARRPEPLGLVRQGQHAAGDVVPGSHVAGASRRVGHGARARRTADAAAARRRDESHGLGGARRESVRERLALHRTQSSCNHCHGVIDPLGQALENYNAIGEWRVRERDTGVAVDPSGSLANGQPVASPVDLREAIAAEPEKFVQTVAQNLMTYALGRTCRVLRHAGRAVRRARGRAEATILSLRSSKASPIARRFGCGPRRSSPRRPWRPRSRAREPALAGRGSGGTRCSSRRSICRDVRSCAPAAPRSDLPLLGAMVPAATALSQTAAAAKPRLGFFYLPHGAIMDNTRHGDGDEPLDARSQRARFRLEADPRAVRSASEVPDGVQRSRQSDGRESRRCTRSFPARG